MMSDEGSIKTDYAASVEQDQEIIDLASEEEMKVDALGCSDSDLEILKFEQVPACDVIEIIDLTESDSEVDLMVEVNEEDDIMLDIIDGEEKLSIGGPQAAFIEIVNGISYDVPPSYMDLVNVDLK